MLYAIEWIRGQLTTIYNSVLELSETLNLESIASFLTQSPMLLVLYILAGLVLVLAGFRFHRLLSGLIGGVVMGYLGWQIGAAINPDLISSSMLCMLISAVIGQFLFYFLYVVNVGLGAFAVCFATARQLSTAGIETGAILGAVFMVLYCILLIRRHMLRTAIEGGSLIGFIVLHYFGYYAALGAFVICVVSGTIRQSVFRKRYEENRQLAREYRPNAPSPPTPEEIAEEIAQEKAEKAARNICSLHESDVMATEVDE